MADALMLAEQGVDLLPFKFDQDACWGREPSLRPPFLARSGESRKSEKHTRADSIVGHIGIRNGTKRGLKLRSDATQFVVIEAKITSDDGTARDKVARIKELETQRKEHIAAGRPSYEVVACIDGRGFRERREDMRQMLLRLDGKVFTTASLDQLITHIRIQEFVTQEH